MIRLMAGDRGPRLATLLALLALAVGLAGSAFVAIGLVRVVEPSDRPVTPRGPLLPHEVELTQLFQRASKSVVHITSTRFLRQAYSRDIYRVPDGSGSGFVWDHQGRIVTNYHVVRNPIRAGSFLEAVLADGSRWPARVIGAAPYKDLAVLEIEAPESALFPIDLGTSRDLLVGQSVYAIGNPFGLDQSLTTGVISALGREINSLLKTTIHDVIQSDAAVNPGNSGGPLLDSAGRLIGVNTAISSPSGASAGVSFAIPVDTVRRFVPDLIEYGRVRKPVIGFQPLARALPSHLPRGVLAWDVPAGSEAERAGLRGTTDTEFGDVIVAVDDLPTPTLAELESVLERYSAGDEVRLKVIRGVDGKGEGGVEKTILIRLQPADSQESP